jgi:hypothetical protein
LIEVKEDEPNAFGADEKPEKPNPPVLDEVVALPNPELDDNAAANGFVLEYARNPAEPIDKMQVQ